MAYWQRKDTYVFPLRNTTFEGAPVMIPFKYKDMLESEYGKEALTNTKFEGYVSLDFVPHQKKLIVSHGVSRHVFDQGDMQWVLSP